MTDSAGQWSIREAVVGLNFDSRPWRLEQVDARLHLDSIHDESISTHQAFLRMYVSYSLFFWIDGLEVGQVKTNMDSGRLKGGPSCMDRGVLDFGG